MNDTHNYITYRYIYWNVRIKKKMRLINRLLITKSLIKKMKIGKIIIFKVLITLQLSDYITYRH